MIVLLEPVQSGWLLLPVNLLGNSFDREIVQNMSPCDSTLITGSTWLVFVTGENVLDSQKHYKTSYSRLGNYFTLSILWANSVYYKIMLFDI